MDHICEAHNVPGEIRKVSLETLFPPWTVTRQVYTESLTSRHSSISNDVLLSLTLGCRWFTTIECTRGVFRTPYFSYRCLRSCRPREGHPTLPARLCHVQRNLRMFCVPHLDRPDARLVAGSQYGLWSRP